ncbi:glycosyltransferase [Flavivirga algicola]|uniref:Glycosyltransferase n=1 Tax=Flavivirga algicola TaxID=2729136 RepID=A0ABX1RXL3_9FLAO|nr:glycosyltransferase [Flavivirga algicola]NMH88335.1 glycosyltransferase [Flavivirga algicola]
MKKIVFVIESLHHGGAEKSLVTLLDFLDYNSFAVKLLLFRKGGEFEKFVPKEVSITYINPFEGINKVSLLFLRARFLINKKLNKNKRYHNAQLFWKTFGNSIRANKITCDTAIAYNQGFATYYVAEKILAQKKYSWLNTDYIKAGYQASFDYNKYTQFKKIICVSQENELAFIKANKLNNKVLPTEIIKDITDDLDIKNKCFEKTEFDLKKDEFKILTVGRLAKAKGFELAIKACKILKDKGIEHKWYVIGEGSERENLERIILEENLEDTFILLGYKENPYPYINTCNIYVQTSLFEGLGLTVIEAAILQKPIVTTNFPTAPSLITHNETGLICEMDANDIAHNILVYIENREFKNKIINNLSKLKNDDKEKSLAKFNKLI